MQPPKAKLSWKTLLFPILGLLGFFLYIYLFQVDIIGIIATAQKANPLLYSIAIVFGVAEVLFYTVSWRVLTNHLGIPTKVWRAFLYVWYGIYVDIVVPAESISGELTRAYLLTKDKCCSFGKAIASLYMHRLLGMAMNIIVLVLGIVLLSFEGQLSTTVFNFIVFIAAGITATIVAMIVLSFKQNWTIKLIENLACFVRKITFGRVKLTKFKEEAIENTAHFHDSMKIFRHNPKPLAVSFFYVIINWAFSLAIPYMVFLSLGQPVSWSIILITAAIVLAVKSIPMGIPFEVGIPEAAMTTLYFSMGVSPALSATVTILSRIITLWFRFFAGFAAQQWLELKPLTQAEVMEKTKNSTCHSTC